MIFEAYEQFELDIVMFEPELTNYSNSTQLTMNRIRVFYELSSSSFTHLHPKSQVTNIRMLYFIPFKIP